MNKNSEVARKLADRFDAYGAADADQIESALTTAQSQLAKEVLAEIVQYKGTFALVRGVEGEIVDVTCNQIDQRLRELFTRLKVQIGEE